MAMNFAQFHLARFCARDRLSARMARNDVPEIQMAAGGLVWRRFGREAKLVVIHRPKYDDWTLPKGKPEKNESPGETARREIQEELGFEAQFLEFAGVIHYPLLDGRTKVVLFWHMTPRGEHDFQANREVDDMLWLTPAEALKKLSHDVERRLVRECGPPAAIPSN